MSQPDKYFALRTRIRELSAENKNRYGCRRMHALPKREDTIVSEKIVRRIMNGENLVVKVKRTAKYNSYAGEATPSVPDGIKRDFSAEKPDSKWLTDITGSAIPAGKAYLSPTMDCFDGLSVSWRTGTSQDSALVNTMSDDTASQLSPEEKPVIHSDRGIHHGWTGRIERMEKAGLARSVSGKGCPPDNSACEGVSGRLKNEMFYSTSRTGASLSDFMDILNNYPVWYNETGIKNH